MKVKKVWVAADVGHTIEGDLLRAELIAVPLTLLLLLFVFRGVVAASLPMFVGVIAVVGTLLSLFVIGSITDVSIYAINLTTAPYPAFPTALPKLPAPWMPWISAAVRARPNRPTSSIRPFRFESPFNA